MYCKICLFCDSHVTLAKLIRILTSVSYYMHCKFFFRVKTMPHWLHWLGVSPVWILQCNEVSQISFNILFWHWLHCYCFALLYVLIWVIGLLFGMKDLSHWLNRLEFILLSALWYLHYLITSNRVIIIKLTVLITKFHCFLDFNTRGCIFIWCNYY